MHQFKILFVEVIASCFQIFSPCLPLKSSTLFTTIVLLDALDIFGAHHVALANPCPLFGDDCLFSLQVFAIVHDRSVVVANSEVVAFLAPLVTLVKVVLPVLWDIAPLDGDVLVPVSSGVLVVKS